MKIVKTTKEDVRRFSNKEWPKLDMLHYGRSTRWISKNFYFKLIEKRKIIGIVTGDFKGGVVYVEELIVMEKDRKRGIGKKLMDKIISYGKQNKAHKIYLFTGIDWPANSFYKQLGYEKIGYLPNHYLNHDFVIYQKPL